MDSYFEDDRRIVPKLREYRDIVRKQKPDGENGDCPDVPFLYDDTDSHLNEMAELYSYTEEPEFQLNRKAFEDVMEGFAIRKAWADIADKRSVVLRLLDLVEVSVKERRQTAARSILYLAQGNWGECQSEEEQQTMERQNCFLLYECGIFNTFVELLKMEVDNSSAANSALRKPAVSLADSTDLRVILSVLYTICEVFRCPNESDTDEMKKTLEEFKSEIIQPMKGNELFAVVIFSMVTKFCSGTAPHFPMKKVLMLLWKVILVSLGGTPELRDLKRKYREDAGLQNIDEDTIEVTRNMRASSPPASTNDLESQQKKPNRPFRRGLMKQSSLDESLALQDMEGDDRAEEELRDIVENRMSDENGDFSQPPTSRPSTPCVAKGLPWTPKVRQKDLENFLDNTRVKFVGYNLEEDSSSLEGLPYPIHEGVKVLKEHMYVSLGEVQIKREDEIMRNLLSQPEPPIAQSPTEILYQAMLPSLPQYMIALLKILLAAAPTSKTKSDSVNIMADVLPEEMPMTVFQSMKLGIDVNRHKEIIVKAVSGILLLLLKHLKINHIYQFEFVSQHMVFANCIPLVLKFFNQNIVSYVQSKSSVAIMDFPSCVIGDQPEITADTLCSYQQIGSNIAFCWRNMFSCINLLRILNKLTKWKHSRIMMLVVFKSAPILKRTLKIKHAMMQLYVLKLLKLQTKYLGRQWRKSNMKTMSAIYQKVRHRLNDDWAYGNDMDARPWDFQAEECALRACVDRFNSRRYGNTPIDPELEPVDNCILSVLGQRIELTEEFKQHYELWLYQEVFQSNIDWSQLVTKQLL